jgi:triacylglycerol lipase
MLSSLAPARRRVVIAALSALGLVVATVVAVVIVRANGDSRAATVPVSQQRPGPVILVPGYGGSTSSLDALATTLRREGKTVQVLALPGDGTGNLDAQASALSTAADRLHRQGAGSVDVVGYSAGGVVARLWVRDYDGASLARRVITLGSPHHGTDLAGLAGSLLPSACPTACQQLEPGSNLLDALNHGDETPAGPTFVSIWTTHDNVVLPANSASLAGALNVTVQSVCRNDTVDHTGLPRDRAVQAMVTAELGPGDPVALTTRNCPTT